MSELMKRALTGVIAGGVSVTALIISPWGHYAFCLIVSMLGLFEFYNITHLHHKTVARLALVFGIIVWAYFILYFIEGNTPIYSFMTFVELNWIMLSCGALGLFSLAVLFDDGETNALRTVALVYGGFFYAFVPIVIFFMLGISPWARTEIGGIQAADTYEFRLPLGLLFLHWMLDVMAYFGGKYLGRKPLFTRISPKKTWAGAIIGTLGCVGLGVVLEFWFPLHWNWVVVALIVSVVSQLGDLVESMFKRSLEIKDSGGVLPGHGGILDRFDGMYLTAPVLYLYYFGVFMLAY